MSVLNNLLDACERLIAVAGERHDKSAPVTFNGAEWEAFVVAVQPPPEVEEIPLEEEPPPPDPEP